MGKHALLSPSAAHRWLHCTPAPRLEARMEDAGSRFAEEGTLAHAYCARRLKTWLGESTDGEDEEIALLAEKYHTGEMDEHTEAYQSFVLERFAKARERTPDARLLVEVRLDFSHWVPEGFGTADAVIIADDLLEVIDFKYGRGVKVEATDNPQMMIYALGAYDAFCLEYDIERVRMTIVQPRLDNLSTFELSAVELGRWGQETLRPKAREAYEGKGEQQAGDWCRFCKVKHLCRTLAARCIETREAFSDPRFITPEEMAENVLPALDTIRTWLAGVETYALEQALSGTHYAGYKLVEGRSIRRISDTAAVISRLEGEGYQREAFMKPVELRGISDLERMVGKKRFAELCAEYITKPQGKPTLVPEKDKRPALTAASDFEGMDF